MKIIGYILLIVLLFSCEKSEYETWLYEPGIEAVDSVAIYPNSPVLIANGKAQLSFLVKAYSFVKDKRDRWGTYCQRLCVYEDFCNENGSFRSI